ncbi:MAG: sortase [Naasia sp.]|jgi:sortase A|uniref:class E sortase n=1 Tax=Naasia sp. TaxID=2546198 RepID=UPI002636533E|nr:class E sortase [Naasia sp.]MCU1570256.1 sortase [Naasia sp.]
MVTPDDSGSPSPPRGPSRSASLVGVLGEVLLTAGVIVLLFLGWQLWWNDAILADSQTSAARAQSEEWGDLYAPGTRLAPSAAPAKEDFGDPLVAAEPAHAEVIGNLYVPRFGTDYVRTIAEGTSTDILNSTRLGLGHYDGTQMPGEVGNFVVAAHRSAYGGALHLVDQLRLGDPLVVETVDGWYTYRFTNLDYVMASAVDVLAPVPQEPGVDAKDRTITLTTCNPLYSTAERIIAYGVLDSWRPRSAGPPAELASILGKG